MVVTYGTVVVACPPTYRSAKILPIVRVGLDHPAASTYGKMPPNRQWCSRQKKGFDQEGSMARVESSAWPLLSTGHYLGQRPAAGPHVFLLLGVVTSTGWSVVPTPLDQGISRSIVCRRIVPVSASHFWSRHRHVPGATRPKQTSALFPVFVDHNGSS
jgi:hypothetical protein